MKLNLEEIFAIIDKVTEHELDLFSYEDEDTKLKIKGHSEQKNKVPSIVNHKMDVKHKMESNLADEEGNKESGKREEKNGNDVSDKKETSVEKETTHHSDEKMILSPMVGTFYSAPSANARAFVQVGDRIKEGQVVCIIEAMKLMNEIESEYSGIVEEVLVKNEEAIEYGQPLIRIRVE